jgi:hypothetical protein
LAGEFARDGEYDTERAGQSGMTIGSALLAMLAVTLVASPAWAGDKHSTLPAATPVVVTTQPFVAATQPFTASSNVANPLAALTPPRPAPDHPRRRRPVTIVTVPVAAPPQTVIVQQDTYYYPVPVMAAASECVTPGYWAYRWTPYTTTQTVWVEGSWAADGSWTDSHWESRPYSAGYYEPVWMPAERC